MKKNGLTYPLQEFQTSLQNGDHEESCGKDFNLKCDLKNGRVQIGYGQVDEIILDGEEQSRNAGLDRVEAVVEDLRLNGRSEFVETPRAFAKEQEERGQHLDELLADDGRRREEHVARRGSHVPKQNDCGRVLYHQNDETYPFQEFV